MTGNAFGHCQYHDELITPYYAERKDWRCLDCHYLDREQVPQEKRILFWSITEFAAKEGISQYAVRKAIKTGQFEAILMDKTKSHSMFEYSYPLRKWFLIRQPLGDERG